MELTLPTVVGAALVDSVNPCAFALLLVFVATMLAMMQRQVAVVEAGSARYWLLSRGGVYISGIFLTYLALGFGLLGALQFAKTLASTMIISKIAALFALGLGLMMLQEALAFGAAVRATWRPRSSAFRRASTQRSLRYGSGMPQHRVRDSAP